jgi:hypothetical protein
MPTLNDLRKRHDSDHRPLRQVALVQEAEILVSDQRGQLTPKDIVESKLGLALARGALSTTERTAIPGRS